MQDQADLVVPRHYFELEELSFKQILAWLAWYSSLKLDNAEDLFKPGYKFVDAKQLLLNAFKRKELSNFVPDNIAKIVVDAFEGLEVFDKNDRVQWRVLPQHTNECHKLQEERQGQIEHESWPQLQKFNVHFGDLRIKDQLPTLGSLSNPNTIVKPLPSINGSFDLKFLHGDLADEAKPTAIVSEINSCLKNYSNNQVHCIVGVSGVGKTKALYDVARENFAVFVDFSQLWNSDVSQFLTEFNMLRESQTDDRECNYRRFNKIVHHLIGTRIAALIALQFQYPKLTPEQWLLAQVKNSIVRMSYRPIKSMLNKYYNEKDLIGLDQLWSSVNNNKKLIIMYDEVQLAMLFNKATINMKDESTSAFDWLVNESLKFGQVIVASKTLKVLNISEFFSNSTSNNGTPVLAHHHLNLRCVDSAEECQAFCERLFDVKLMERQVQYIYDKLQGRAIYLTTLVHIAQLECFHKKEGVPNERILMKIVDVAFNAIAFNSVPDDLNHHASSLTRNSVYNAIARKLTRNTKTHGKFAKLLEAYLLHQQLVFNPTHCFLEDGILGIEARDDGGARYKPTEVLLDLEVNFAKLLSHTALRNIDRALCSCLPIEFAEALNTIISEQERAMRPLKRKYSSDVNED